MGLFEKSTEQLSTDSFLTDNLTLYVMEYLTCGGFSESLGYE